MKQFIQRLTNLADQDLIVPELYEVVTRHIDLCELLLAGGKHPCDISQLSDDCIINLCLYVAEVEGSTFKKAHEDYCRVMKTCSVLEFYQKWVSFIPLTMDDKVSMVQTRILYKICNSEEYLSQQLPSSFFDFLNNEYDNEAAVYVFQAIERLKKELGCDDVFSTTYSEIPCGVEEDEKVEKFSKDSLLASFEELASVIQSKDELFPKMQMDRTLKEVENEESVNFEYCFNKDLNVEGMEDSFKNRLILFLQQYHVNVATVSDATWNLTFNLKDNKDDYPRFENEKIAFEFLKDNNFSIDSLYKFENWKVKYWIPYLSEAVIADALSAINSFSLQIENVVVWKIKTRTSIYEKLFEILKSKGYCVEDHYGFYEIKWRT